MLYWSYQLYGINQHGEVWVGLVLLNDGGTQCFTCTLYEDLEKERRGLLLLYLLDIRILSPNCDGSLLCNSS